MGKRIIEILRYLIECVIEVVYPSENICLICSTLLDGEELLCLSCADKIKSCKESFLISRNGVSVVNYSAAYYTNVITELIIRLKYKGDFRCGEALGALMFDVIKEKQIDFDLIAFVPMKAKEFKRRGYNQSEYLARLIGKSTKIPVCNTLIKMKESKDQIGLDGLLRWENLKGCFIAVNTKEIKDKKILLVDDVITTGATGFYCASELLFEGAKEVTILTGAKSSI